MKNKIIAIHQPYFLPWLGFFDKIAKADIYVVFSDVETDWRNQSVLNRNKIKTPQGAKWLTVPIHAHNQTKIKDIIIDNERPWREDHLKTLYFNYKKAKNFDKLFPLIEKIYHQKQDKIVDLNLALIKLMMGLLKIKTKIESDLVLQGGGHKNELLIDLTKKVGGTSYLSGQGAKNYLDLAKFKAAGIDVIFQNYSPIKYRQLWGDFIPNLSALDYLFCDGRPFSTK